MPFAINDATRFISPTKTPEYLAAGLPVVSTPIADVVDTYGEMDAVRIADTPERFIAACEEALALDRDALRPAIDAKLAGMTWDETFRRSRTCSTKRSAARTSRSHGPRSVVSQAVRPTTT